MCIHEATITTLNSYFIECTFYQHFAFVFGKVRDCHDDQRNKQRDIYFSVPLNEIMAYLEFVLVGIRMECCMGT